MATPLQSHPVTPQEIADVAPYLSNVDCVQLATALGFGSLYIRKLNANPVTSQTPFTILYDWKSAHGQRGNATNVALREALTKIGAPEVAELIAAKLSGQPGPTLTGQPKGIRLNPGSRLFNDISKYFDERLTRDLAAELLEHKHPMGGSGFIQSKISSFGASQWDMMALFVLEEWCTKSKETFGADLLKVLDKVLPFAAQKFKQELLGTT